MLMIARAVLSWIPVGESVYDFLCGVTEPVVIPARVVFDKFGWDADLPIDLPFIATFFILDIILILV